jgi:hypothetical protein
MKKLKKSDPCPCCGQPIKTDNPVVLDLLSWVAEQGRLPTVGEMWELIGTANGNNGKNTQEDGRLEGCGRDLKGDETRPHGEVNQAHHSGTAAH